MFAPASGIQEPASAARRQEISPPLALLLAHPLRTRRSHHRLATPRHAAWRNSSSSRNRTTGSSEGEGASRRGWRRREEETRRRAGGGSSCSPAPAILCCWRVPLRLQTTARCRRSAAGGVRRRPARGCQQRQRRHEGVRLSRMCSWLMTTSSGVRWSLGCCNGRGLQ